MADPVPPIVVKHHIFEGLEALSRDWVKVQKLCGRLAADVSAAELVEIMVENGVCSPELGELIGERWLDGARFVPIRAQLLEIAQAIGQGGPYLSAWWVLGVSNHVQIRHLLLDDSVLLLLFTPHMPLDIVLGKARTNTDPTGRRLAAAYRSVIDQVLFE